VLPRTKFDFHFSGAAGLTTEVQIATRIDISRYRESVFYVRTHAESIVNSWATPPTLMMYADGFTDEDPTAGAAQTAVGAQFTSSLGSLALATNGAPQLQTLTVPTNSGSLLLLTIQMKSVGAAQYTAWLSVDLSGKE